MRLKISLDEDFSSVFEVQCNEQVNLFRYETNRFLLISTFLASKNFEMRLRKCTHVTRF